MRSITEDKLQHLEESLDKAGQIGVVAHTHPDGDAIGSGMALTEYLREKGKKAFLIIPDNYSDNLKFAVSENLIINAAANIVSASDWIDGSELIVCLDMNSFSRAAILEEMLYGSKAKKILIDHHLKPEEEAFDLVFSETEISSTSELLFHILTSLPGSSGADGLSMAVAAPLMVGMTTDTNNFANSVYPSTLNMASELLRIGVNRDDILDKLYNSSRENRMRAMGHFLSEKLKITHETVAFVVFDKETLTKFDIREGETEGFVNLPLSIKKVKISIFLKEDDGHFRVSIRSKKGYSAAGLAREYFNGGGHENASGGKLFFPGDIAEANLAERYIIEKTARFLQDSCPQNN